jgi:hypothetical protein
VILDAWASHKANYMQGGHLLQDTTRIASEWLQHYAGLGAVYPLWTIFASGTHSDINPNSWKQARGFADGIIAYNATGTNAAKLVNGTLGMFCREVDAVELATPFLPALQGDFGHSWELRPVSLASTAAAARENKRAYLVAIAAFPASGLGRFELHLSQPAASETELAASRAHRSGALASRAGRERTGLCGAVPSVPAAWAGTEFTDGSGRDQMTSRTQLAGPKGLVRWLWQVGSSAHFPSTM